MKEFYPIKVPRPAHPEPPEQLPKVSVITPAYNQEKYIVETVKSVLAQDYPAIEYIVVDDGSSDETPSLLSGYTESIRYYRHQNIGENPTVNKAYKMATGDYVMVVNADDPLLRTDSVRQLARALSSSNGLAAYPDWVEIDEKGIIRSKNPLPNYSFRGMLETFNAKLGPGMMIRASSLRLVGLRNEQLRYTGDLDLSFRLAKHGPLIHVPLYLATHRSHPDSTSSTAKSVRMAQEVLRLATCYLPMISSFELSPKKRNSIMSTAYKSASTFCGTSNWLRSRYLFQALICWLRSDRRDFKHMISLQLRGSCLHTKNLIVPQIKGLGMRRHHLRRLSRATHIAMSLGFMWKPLRSTFENTSTSHSDLALSDRENNGREPEMRILYVGELHSSHALAWMESVRVLIDKYDIKGFHLSEHAQPPFAPFPIISWQPDKRDDADGDMSEWQDSQSVQSILHSGGITIYGIGNAACGAFLSLYRTILEYKPHIIHTFGIFPASVFYLRLLYMCRSNRHNSQWPLWICQVRGGPDLCVNQKNEVLLNEIRQVFDHCDYLVADNCLNYELAKSIGLDPAKVSSTGPVPGTAGVDTEFLQDLKPPSKRNRTIIWPKAYTCIQSDGFSVLEGLRLALSHVEGITLLAYACTPDIEYWMREKLGGGSHVIKIFGRVERQDYLAALATSRVMLAPSLMEGVPNSMYESMAAKTVPILSPLPTLVPLFQDRANVLYADNLSPDQIASAITVALTDDPLADCIAKNNSTLLESIGNRNIIRGKIDQFYRQAYRRQFTSSQ